MKKILIIGSEGYIGSRLVDYFNLLNYECHGIDIGYFRFGALYHPKSFNNICKKAQEITERDLVGHDVVIHLAGISNDPIESLDPNRIYNPTRLYAIKIAEMCKKLGIRYIFPSSCSVYGIGIGKLDENSETKPQTGYSLNKVQVENDLSELADNNFSPIALRLATVFGASPRIRFDVVINMLCGMAIAEKRIVLNSNGKAWRPHVYIEDVCEAIRCCVDWNYDKGKLLVLNVGRNENNQRIIDVAKLIQKEIGDCQLEYMKNITNQHEMKLVQDRKVQDGVDKRSYKVEFEKIHSTLPGFSAKWSIEQGIKQLIEDLQYWKLDEIKFKQREFYRLQQIEYLWLTKQFEF